MIRKYPTLFLGALSLSDMLKHSGSAHASQSRGRGFECCWVLGFFPFSFYPVICVPLDGSLANVQHLLFAFESYAYLWSYGIGVN